MDDQFIIATWARDSVIAGDLEAVREPLRALAQLEYPEQNSARWSSNVKALQSVARETAKAQSLAEAARGVATMASVCGRCHAESAGGPTSHVERREVFSEYGETTFTGRMYRHAWGMTALWDGLTAPSLDAWRKGAVAIAEASHDMELELPGRLGQELARLRALAREAEQTADPWRQTEFFAELLTTCASCHGRAVTAAGVNGAVR